MAVYNGSLNVNYVKVASIPLDLKLTTKTFDYLDKDNFLYGVM